MPRSALVGSKPSIRKLLNEKAKKLGGNYSAENRSNNLIIPTSGPDAEAGVIEMRRDD